jgi:hypothetical protein
VKKKEYYRAETVRILLYPLCLILWTWFFVAEGWVKTEDAPIVWAVTAIQALASLLAIGVYYFVAE